MLDGKLMQFQIEIQGRKKKKRTPMNTKDLLRPFANRIRRFVIAHRENVSATVEDKLNARTIERDILLLSHSLEKGMGIPDARLGFGKAKAQQLISLLEVARHRGISYDSFALAEGMARLASGAWSGSFRHRFFL